MKAFYTLPKAILNIFNMNTDYLIIQLFNNSKNLGTKINIQQAHQNTLSHFFPYAENSII